MRFDRANYQSKGDRRTRHAAMALVAFMVAASVIALNFWRYCGPEKQGLCSTINIAVVGGLILAAIANPQ
jgi:putative oxidoreductase